MKRPRHRRAAITGICALAFAAFLQQASAQTVQREQRPLIDMNAQPVKADSSVTAEVRATVTFTQGVEVNVEHEPVKNALPEIDTQNAVTTRATVTIRGLPDEQALMTCGVETAKQGLRDCAGGKSLAQHAIMGGRSLESGILLTSDLLPNPTGMSESSITIEVTYM